MQRWLQFLFLLLTVRVIAHVPEPKGIPRFDDLNGNLVQAGSKLQVLLQPVPGGSRSTGRADFPVCRIAGFPTRSAHDVVPAADLEIGDTWPVEWKRECVPCGLVSKYSTGRAGLETCARVPGRCWLYRDESSRRGR